MNVEPQRLKKFLLDAGLMKEKDFDRALQISTETNQKISDVLVAEGLIEQEKLTKFQAYILGVPFVNLAEVNIAPEVLSMIPEQIARAHNIIAFRRIENNLEVAMLDPEDLITIEFIKKADPLLKILPRLTTPEGVKNALRQYQKTLDIEFGDIIKKETKFTDSIKKYDKSFVGKEVELVKAAQDLPIIKVVDTLLKHAVLQRASDVHIEPSENEVMVRFRVDGILHEVMSLPITTALGIVARIKILSDLKLDEHRLPQDGRF